MREGFTKSGKVIGTSLTNRALTIENDNRNWVSVLEGISVIGSHTTPCVVFAGNSVQAQWFPAHFPDWKFDYSMTGWANSRVCDKWLHLVFEPETRPEIVHDWRILVVDGFSGHISPRFRFRAEFNRIKVLYLPPHTSHITQPLDVGIFGPLKRYFAHHAKPYAGHSHNAPVGKQRFIKCYELAYKKAMTPRNI